MVWTSMCLAAKATITVTPVPDVAQVRLRP